MSSNLASYYHERANEYERVYAKPERQTDIGRSIDLIQDLFRDKEVLEIACGTGFWTSYISDVARSLLAIDVNKSVIDIALKKNFSNPAVKFEITDFYDFRAAKKYESLFGGFIWSHIPKQDLNHFYKTVNNLASKDGRIVLMDNFYVEGSNLPITRTDGQGNTFQTRSLSDGSIHEVLKNFATEAYFRETLSGLGTDIGFTSLKYFWIASYRPL